MFSKQLLLKHTSIESCDRLQCWNSRISGIPAAIRSLAAHGGRQPWLEQLPFGKHNKPVEWMGLACQPHIIGYILNEKPIL